MKMRKYMSKVRVEFKKITWPGRRMFCSKIGDVLGVTILLSSFLVLCDQGFQMMIRQVLNLI